MTLLNYLVQVNVYLLLFYSFYRLLLRNETFFYLNRTYLVASALLSFFIPILQSDWVKSLFITERITQATETVVLSAVTIISIAPEETSSFSFTDYATGIYLLGVAFFAVRFLIGLTAVISRPSQGAAFSFFNKIVVAESLPERETIMAHEKVHAHQLHSADIILFEIIAIINWFNPVVYLYKRSIRYIHEFTADEIASAKKDKSEYALLLLGNALGLKSDQLVNSFFNDSLLKRRILMLQKTKSNKVAILKYGLSVPLFMLAAAVSAAAAVEKINGMETSLEVKPKEIFVTLRKPEPKTDEKVSERIVRTNRPQTNSELAKGSPVDESAALQEEEAKPLQDTSIYDFSSLDKQPQFPGGIGKFYEYVSKNFKLTDEAKKQGVNGRLIMNFVVNADGSLSNIRVLRGLGYGTDEEGIRLLKESPNWIPGVQNGRPVRVQYTLPIMLNSKGSDKGDFIIKGEGLDKAYITLDGKHITVEEMKKIDPKTVESISVIKEKDKYSQYNAPSTAEGIIIIKTKKP